MTLLKGFIPSIFATLVLILISNNSPTQYNEQSYEESPAVTVSMESVSPEDIDPDLDERFVFFDDEDDENVTVTSRPEKTTTKAPVTSTTTVTKKKKTTTTKATTKKNTTAKKTTTAKKKTTTTKATTKKPATTTKKQTTTTPKPTTTTTTTTRRITTTTQAVRSFNGVYILNTNTHKYHTNPDCRGVHDMKPENRQDSYTVPDGYTWCKWCQGG